MRILRLSRLQNCLQLVDRGVQTVTQKVAAGTPLFKDLERVGVREPRAEEKKSVRFSGDV